MWGYADNLGVIPALEEFPSLAGVRGRDIRQKMGCAGDRRHPKPNKDDGRCVQVSGPQPLASTSESRQVPTAAFALENLGGKGGKTASGGPTPLLVPNSKMLMEGVAPPLEFLTRVDLQKSEVWRTTQNHLPHRRAELEPGSLRA